jgi:hypothetical protein
VTATCFVPAVPAATVNVADRVVAVEKPGTATDTVVEAPLARPVPEVGLTMIALSVDVSVQFIGNPPVFFTTIDCDAGVVLTGVENDRDVGVTLSAAGGR